MAADRVDEFYVGWQPQAPAGLGKWLKGVILLVFAVLTLVALVLVFAQQPFYPSIFEFGTYRTFTGLVQEKPYPALLVQRPHAQGQAPEQSRYHLVAFGKLGAQDLVNGLDGRQVQLEGSLVYRDDQTMIELVEGSIKQLAADGKTALPAPENLGTVQLVGEIVDSKCYLGVMNPGDKKPHKSCAIRCISGGIPPVLAVDHGQGGKVYYLLSSAAGETVNQQVLSMVARPVRISGQVERHGSTLVLRADPATYQLLD